MNRNEFERLVDQGIAGEITEAKMYEIYDYEEKKRFDEGECIYLENIVLSCFEGIYLQSGGDHDLAVWLYIKQILTGEKSCFFNHSLRMPSGNGVIPIPAKARWLLDLTHDSEWATLRELITQYRETRFISPDIRWKYSAKWDDEFECKTIIDLMKNSIYYNIATLMLCEDDDELKRRGYTVISYGETVDPVDFTMDLTNKLLRIIDFCEGKTFFLLGVNYLKGQPMISLFS